MTNLILLFLAGGCGTLARYGLTVLVGRAEGGAFEYGTSLVNALGCLLFGFVMGLVLHRRLLGEEQGMVLLVGFLGAFTTFSTFAYDATRMLEHGRWGVLAVYVVSQNVLGVLFVALGLRLAR